MTPGWKRGRRVARGPVLAGLACLGFGAPCLAQGFFAPFDDEERFLEPPLALPQQLNGTVRRAERPAAITRIDRITDVFPAIRACWQPPSGSDGPTGQQVTVRFSFKRSGEVLGRPQITYYKAGGDREAQQGFRTSVVQALQRCSPLPFTEAFGSAVAGRPFTVRFIDDRPA